jgi:hypothetical protein
VELQKIAAVLKTCLNDTDRGMYFKVVFKSAPNKKLGEPLWHSESVMRK